MIIIALILFRIFIDNFFNIIIIWFKKNVDYKNNDDDFFNDDREKVDCKRNFDKKKTSTTNEINVFDKNFQKNKNQHDWLIDKRLKNFYQFVDDNE